MRTASTATFALILLVTWGHLQADKTSEQAQAEQQLNSVRAEIQAITGRLQESREDLGDLQSQLRETDLAIQGASLEFRRLETEADERRKQLGALEQQRDQYLANLDQKIGQLGEQVRSSYKAGNQSRLQLLLNQDDPATAGRLLAYYEYLNRAQLERINKVRDALAGLEQVQLSISDELSRLATLQQEQRVILDDLEVQRDDRESLLADMAEQISSEEQRLAELQQNQQDLQQLIERLADVLADIPADLDQKQRISQQKGRLAMPLKGPVRRAFGQKRSADMRWQGWLIGGDAGSEVSAVAHGRVVFADWLRGYGLLLIIDHGDGYMSLYGNNESLLHELGDWVSPGDTISIVGSNPGGDQGLFFELRKDGKAIDPAGWINRS